MQEDLSNDISGDNELHICILHTIHLYQECQSMANNPPLSSIGLILVVNSAIEKAMVVITLLNDLMARVRIISPNPSLLTHYIK